MPVGGVIAGRKLLQISGNSEETKATDLGQGNVVNTSSYDLADSLEDRDTTGTAQRRLK